MRIAIVGAGSVGGFVGAAMARAGHQVDLLARPGDERRGRTTLDVSSRLLGEFEAAVESVERVAPDVDVVFVTVRTFQLDRALDALGSSDIGSAMIVPLTNGIDHVAALRARSGADRVIAGTIRVEVERLDA